MSFARRVSLLVSGIAITAAAVGCSSTVEGDDESASSKVTLTGKVGGAGAGAGSGIGTRTFGNVSTSSGSLHVSAHELHARGGTGRNVDVVVSSSDGSFRLDLARGARWVVTVDDAEGKSAIVTFGNSNNSALAVRAGDGNATVDVGNVHIVGGEASTDVIIDGKLGIEATIAGLDEVFRAADGVIVAAQEAAAEARKAADEARKAAASAQDAADDARRAAEAAAAAAGNR